MMVWVVGGATAAQQVWPKTVDKMLGLPDDASRGLSKLVWLNALNISVRKSSLKRSVNWNDLVMLRSTFQYLGELKMLRPAPSDPGAGIANALASAKTTGPATPALSCNFASTGLMTSARETCEKFAVLTPLVTLNGSPVINV